MAATISPNTQSYAAFLVDLENTKLHTTTLLSNNTKRALNMLALDEYKITSTTTSDTMDASDAVSNETPEAQDSTYLSGDSHILSTAQRFGDLATISPYESDIVTVIIGRSRSPARKRSPRTFFIHKRHLVQYSQVFRLALRTSTINEMITVLWTEGKSLEIRLPEDRAEDFSLFADWMYWTQSRFVQGMENAKRSSEYVIHCQAIDAAVGAYTSWKHDRAKVRAEQLLTKPRSDSSTQLPGSETKTLVARPTPPAFRPLVQLYIFADKYDVDNEFKCVVCRKVQEVARTANCFPCADDVSTLYDHVLTNTTPQTTESYGSKPSGSDAIDGISSCRLPNPEHNLKRVILELYKDLPKKSVITMFNTNSKEDMWHPTFLLDLVNILFTERHGDIDLLKHKTTTKDDLRRHMKLKSKEQTFTTDKGSCT